jgi:hypothetical protein
MKDPDFSHPEIEQLNEFYLKWKFESKTDRTKTLSGKSYYPWVNFKLAGESFGMFVDDEYEDLRKNYPLLNLCIVLRELEGYDFTPEYKVWCKERMIDAKDKEVREAFLNLQSTYNRVIALAGEVESYVSDFDFELNAGAAQALRRD